MNSEYVPYHSARFGWIPYHTERFGMEKVSELDNLPKTDTAREGWISHLKKEEKGQTSYYPPTLHMETSKVGFFLGFQKAR